MRPLLVPRRAARRRRLEAGDSRCRRTTPSPPRTSEDCARAQRVDVRPGDVLLVRTGYGDARGPTRPTSPDCRRRVEVGQHLGGGQAASPRSAPTTWRGTRWQERDPDTNMMLFGHVHLLVTHGIHILENLNLEELAAAGHHEFCFVGVPLKFRGATGSPDPPARRSSTAGRRRAPSSLS